MARSKKDIDKELMYKKLLPTSMAAEEAEKAARTEEQPRPEPQTPAPPMPEPQRPGPEAALVAPQQQAFAAAADAPSAAPAPSAPAPAERRPSLSQPVNLMEDFVEARVDEAIKKFNCCSCEKCRKDIMALALNKLPPHYVIEEDVNLRDEKEKERASDVATALVQAILVVKSNPSH